MALTYNNTVNPAQNALNKKLDTSPLSIFKAPTAKQSVPQTKIGGTTTPSMISQSPLDAAYSRARVSSTPVTQETKKTSTPTMLS